MTKTIAHIQLLGGFSITIGGRSVSDQCQRSKKPWNILEYLIYYHDREIPSSELSDLIWGDNPNTNPANALKTLIFRSRKLLEPLGLPVQELIVQRRSTYSWTPDIEIQLDADQFEHLCTQSRDPGLSDDERLALLLQALELYKGDFLPQAAWETWVIPINDHFHKLFLQTALAATEMLSSRSDWESLTAICRQAIAIEPFYESFYYHLIYALYHMGDQAQALERYQAMTDLFYNKFAITPSERMKDLYKIIQDKEHGVTTDLSLIQQSMQENLHSTGAYACEYTVFRDIYRLERRAIERTGDSIFLCLLTISTEDGMLPKSLILGRAMEHLNKVIMSSLRRGDVYTRYSVSQYLILLPSASFENGEMVMQRIIRNFKKEYVRKDLNVHFCLQAIEPGPDRQ